METGTTVLHSLHIFNTLDYQKKILNMYSQHEFLHPVLNGYYTLHKL